MTRSTMTAILLGGVLAMGTSIQASRTAMEPIDPNMAGARILYDVSGGIAAIDETLRVFDDGMIRYEWSRSGGTPWFIDLRFPVSEVRALKSLFQAADFASMPARWDAKNEIVDGFEILVKAELADGSMKSVRSSTGADESDDFILIRKSLEKLVADVRSTEVFRLESYGASVDGREKSFAMLADGRFRVESIVDGMPVDWYEGQVTLVERQQMLDSIAAFDFTKARVCAGEHLSGRQYELFAPTSIGRVRVARFSADDENPLLAPLQAAADVVDRVVSAIER